MTGSHIVNPRGLLDCGPSTQKAKRYIVDEKLRKENARILHKMHPMSMTAKYRQSRMFGKRISIGSCLKLALTAV